MPAETYRNVHIPSFRNTHVFSGFEINDGEVSVIVDLPNEKFVLHGTKYGTGFSYPQFAPPTFASDLTFLFPTDPPLFIENVADPPRLMAADETTIADLFSKFSVFAAASFDVPSHSDGPEEAILTTALKRPVDNGITMWRSDLEVPLLEIDEGDEVVAGMKPGTGLSFALVTIKKHRRILEVRAYMSNGWSVSVFGGEIVEMPWRVLNDPYDFGTSVVDFDVGDSNVAVLGPRTIYVRRYDAELVDMYVGRTMRWGEKLWRIHNPILTRERYVLTALGVALHNLHKRELVPMVSFTDVADAFEEHEIVEIVPSADGRTFLLLGWSANVPRRAAYVLFDAKERRIIDNEELPPLRPSGFMAGKRGDFLVFGRAVNCDGSTSGGILANIFVEENEEQK